ncbi:hypothetical protein [uncultured Ruegeria sp.]|uniref:hypothetical protein n=1 Tax=uncultured Ruegeria sp. TaxID=259304 RepID=UPI00263689AD|nr:hypothetical protein [uncultured Ruegeria sp.]
MKRISTAHRIYFFAVCSFGLFVGGMGYLAPELISWAVPLTPPPLHARTVASLYLAGGTMMLLAGLAQDARQVRLPTVVATIWTGSLGIVTLLYLDQFDTALRSTWFWFFAYSVYPVAGVYFILRFRRGPTSGERAPLPRMNRVLLGVLGAFALAVSLLLLFLPGVMVNVWPWKLSLMLAQIYGGPLMGLAVIALLMTTADKEECFISAVGISMFPVLALAASLMHLNLFAPWAVSSVIWFSCLGIASLAGAFVLMGIAARKDSSRKGKQ